MNLLEENAALKQENKYLREQVKKLKKENKYLRSKIDQLEKKLNQILNHNTPTSQIPIFIKPKTLSPNRDPVGTNKRGKPIGSPGATRTIPTKVDKIIEVKTDRCSCGSNNVQHLKTNVRYVYDILFMPTLIMFKVYQYKCEDCKQIFNAKNSQLPRKGILGNNLVSFLAELKQNALSYEKCANLIEDISGFKFSPNTLNNCIIRLGLDLESDCMEIKRRLRSSNATFIDESGWKINGENYQLWCFNNRENIFFEIDKSRGRSVPIRILGPEFDGLVHSDCLCVYDKFANRFQKCWAHLLRKSFSLSSENPDGDIVKLHKNLSCLFNEVNNFLKNNPTGDERRKMFVDYTKKLGLLKNCDWKSGGAKGIIKNWLKKYDGHWLSCVLEQGGELTNNRSERCLRKGVVVRKMIGGHRTWQGATSYAAIESCRQTWRLGGKSAFLKMRDRLEMGNLAL